MRSFNALRYPTTVTSLTCHIPYDEHLEHKYAMLTGVDLRGFEEDMADPNFKPQPVERSEGRATILMGIYAPIRRMLSERHTVSGLAIIEFLGAAVEIEAASYETDVTWGRDAFPNILPDEQTLEAMHSTETGRACKPLIEFARHQEDQARKDHRAVA